MQVEGGEGWERTQSQGNTVVLSTTRKEFDQNWRGLKQLLIFQEDTAKKINTDKKYESINQSFSFIGIRGRLMQTEQLVSSWRSSPLSP